MSDTPRTDSEILGPYAEIEWCVDPDCARQLERELSATTERADNLAVECQAAIYERNERRAEVERLRGKYVPIEKVCAYIDGRLRCLHCETLLAEEKAEVERLRDLLREAPGWFPHHDTSKCQCGACGLEHRIRAALEEK